MISIIISPIQVASIVLQLQQNPSAEFRKNKITKLDIDTLKVKSPKLNKIKSFHKIGILG